VLEVGAPQQEAPDGSSFDEGEDGGGNTNQLQLNSILILYG
jgi:hypothetical protein